MKFVEWCDLFLIGHETIDRQHQALFEIANRFHEAVNKGFDSKVTLNTLNQLIQYAQKHFADEEQITSQLEIPPEILEHHQQTHDKLISDVFSLNEKIESGKIVAMDDVERFIREWLVLHILIEDQKYKAYLSRETQGTKASVASNAGKAGPTTIKYP